MKYQRELILKKKKNLLYCTKKYLGVNLTKDVKKEMATHSRILARRVPWMEEPGRLQFMGSQRVGQTLTKEVKDLYAENYKALIKETENYSSKWKAVPRPWIGRILLK